jgi:hypothetical protein
MAASGTTISMIRSIESNAKLLNRTNMFNKLKNINLKSGQKYTYLPMSKEALATLRKEESSRLKSNLIKRRVIGILVIIPTSIILMSGVYVLVQALM